MVARAAAFCLPGLPAEKSQEHLHGKTGNINDCIKDVQLVIWAALSMGVWRSEPTQDNSGQLGTDSRPT